MRLNRLLLISAALLGLAAVGWFYYRFDPEHTVWMPQCLFRRLTGWNCPACGAQRAFYHLLHGRFVAAFRFNPFMLVSVPYLLAVGWTTFDHRQFAERCREYVQHPRVVRTYFWTVVLWWIGRNIFGI